MSNFGDHPAGFFGDSSFYNGAATQSLKFDDGSSAYLTGTPDEASNRRTFTWSGWVKRCSPATTNVVFSSYVDSSNFFAIRLRANGDNGRLEVIHYSSGNDLNLTTTQVIRDVSAWYNIVVAIDTTQGTNTNRAKVYINGSQVTDFSVATYPSENFDTDVNIVDAHYVGSLAAGNYHDGYLSDVNFIDGLALTPTSFGETKNGVWIPKTTSGLTFGTNGFRLQFAQVGVGTASTSTIGADTSGNTNHFTSSGIVASDCAILDSPENNFATYNPLQIASPSAAFFLSDGNLALTATNNDGYRNCSATFSPMGFKGYIEFVASALNHKIGIIVDATHPAKLDYGNSGPQHVTLDYNGEVKFPNNGTTFRSASDHALGTLATGDVMAMAFDFTGTNRNVWFARANTYGTASSGAGNPATGANPIVSATQLNSTDPYRFHFGINNGPVLRINFGQDGTFGGTETAQGNTDENGNGNFYYAVPAGFLAMCSANLPELTIGPNSDTQADDHFNTVIYTGDDGSDRGVTGVGFQPDWVWLKNRNGTGIHGLFDSNRGVTKYLRTDTNATEATASGVKSFDSNGFTLGSAFNQDTLTFVAWNWKANGGTATATISESGNNPAASVQANPTAGFSLITYTGTGALGTIAHGLGAVPKWMIIKNRDATDAWNVFHSRKGNTHAFYLNLTQVPDDNTSFWNDTSPTSSVFTINTDHGVNADGEKYVAYVFAEVEGYSKFGSYIGNGGSDGSYIYTGFRPAWILLKASTQGSAGYAWFIQDTTRNPSNTASVNHLFANLAVAENDSGISTAANNVVDVLSNGFKCRYGGGATNGSGVTMIYMAFAESPFKYANAI